MWPYLCLNLAPKSANLKQKNQFTFHLKMYLKFCLSVAFTKNIKQSTRSNPPTLKRDFDQTSNQIKPIWGKYTLHDLYGQVPKYNLCFRTDTIDRKKLIESLVFFDTRFHILGPKYDIVSDPWYKLTLVPKVIWYFISFFKYIIYNVWCDIRIYFTHFSAKYLQIWWWILKDLSLSSSFSMTAFHYRQVLKPIREVYWFIVKILLWYIHTKGQYLSYNNHSHNHFKLLL